MPGSNDRESGCALIVVLACVLWVIGSAALRAMWP